MTTAGIPHVVILGGGYGGFHVARGVHRAAKDGRIALTVVESQPYMTYKPLLPEVAGGHTQPRDVTVDLARALPAATVVPATVRAVNRHSATAVLGMPDGTQRPIGYDHVVFALGAVAKTLPIPGLAEQAVGCSTLEEAVYLRNHVLDRIRLAAGTSDPVERDRALRFVFVGGGYTGVETIAELQELAAHAHAAHPRLRNSPLHWVLIEAADRIAAELSPPLSDWTLALLRRRGISVRLKTEMVSCENGVVTTNHGDTFPTDTLVWTAGVSPSPTLDHTDMPRGHKGHLQANARLQIIDNDGTPVAGAWAIGDNAEIPDLTADRPNSYCAPTAQHALRQAKLLSRNIIRALDGTKPLVYRHKSLGTLASYGGGRGAAEVKGLPVRGYPAWVLDKLYHGIAMPDGSRRVRITANWAANALASRDLTSTSAAEHPRAPFVHAITAQQAEKAQAG